MAKTKDMMLHESRRGFFGVSVSLHRLSPNAKKPIIKPDKSFHIELNDDEKPKKSDYKEIIDYIKDNEINILNKNDFKWLK